MSSCVTKTEALALVRSLYRELRPASIKSNTPVYKTQTWKYLIQELKNANATTTSKDSPRIAYNTGQTYLEYLRSSHQHLNLVTAYKGKGERSTKETAGIVGFGLPSDPKPPRKQRH